MTATQNSPDEAKVLRRARRKRRRRLVIGVLVLLAVGFYCFVTFRGPPDYAGEFAQLLPARTSAFIGLNDFGGLRDHVAQTRLYAELSTSLDVAALLLTSEDWRKLQEDKDSVEGKAKAALAREFLRRYFSKQVVVALSQLDGCETPALLVMAKTDLGFAEKLAELCAELYPDLQLQTEKLRGVPIHIYEGEKPKRSFSFVRFGKTVVISLRSNDREFLRRIVDYRLDAPGDTLFETEDFRRAWDSPARRRGLLAMTHPAALISDMIARSDFTVSDYFEKPSGKKLRLALAQIKMARIEMTVTDALSVKTTMRLRENSNLVTLTDPPEKPLGLLKTVPEECLAFMDFRFGDLAECLARVLNLHRILQGDPSNDNALAEAIENLNDAWGIDIDQDLAPVLGEETAVVIHDVKLPMLLGGSLLIPVTDRTQADVAVGKIIKRYADHYARPENALEVPSTFRRAPDFQPLYSTPIGFLGLGKIEDFYVWGLNPEPFLAIDDLLSTGGQTIKANTVFRSLNLPIGRPLDVVAFVNLEEIGRRAEPILSVLALTSKSVRERWGKYSKIIAVARLLAGIGLFADHTENEWTVVLKVPTP